MTAETVKIVVTKIGDTYITKLKSGRIVIFDREYGFTYDPEEPECHVYMTNILEAVADGVVPQRMAVDVKVKPLKRSYLVIIREHKAVVDSLDELPRP